MGGGGGGGGWSIELFIVTATKCRGMCHPVCGMMHTKD